MPVGVLLAPIIPALTDHEIEAPARGRAPAPGLRAPAFCCCACRYEVAQLFEEWLREHFPDRAERVLNRIREMRGGKLNDPRFGHRMRGRGRTPRFWPPASRRAAGATGSRPAASAVLDTSQFLGDLARPAQGELFARDCRL